MNLEGDEYNQYQVRRVSPQRWKNIQKLLASANFKDAGEAWKSIDADYLLLKKMKYLDAVSTEYLGETVFENRALQLIKNPQR